MRIWRAGDHLSGSVSREHYGKDVKCGRVGEKVQGPTGDGKGGCTEISGPEEGMRTGMGDGDKVARRTFQYIQTDAAELV